MTNSIKTWWQRVKNFEEDVGSIFDNFFNFGILLLSIGIIFLIITLFINPKTINFILSIIIIFFGISIVILLTNLKKKYGVPTKK